MQPQGLQRREFELAEIPKQRSWFARKTPQACEEANMKASVLAPTKSLNLRGNVRVRKEMEQLQNPTRASNACKKP
jgi:hypothetical protein